MHTYRVMHVSSELVSSDVNMVTLLMTVRSAQEVWFIGWGVHCCVDHTSWAHRQTHTYIHTPPNAAEVTPLSDDTSYYVVQSCRLITAFQESHMCLHDSVWSRGCSTEPHTVDWGEWTCTFGHSPWGCQQYTYCWYVALYTISYAAIHLCICLLYNIRMIDCVDYMMQKKGLPLRKLSASKAFHLSF